MMKKMVIILFLLSIHGCTSRSPDFSATGAPVILNNGDTLGQIRTKINDGFTEHEAEIATLETEVAGKQDASSALTTYSTISPSAPMQIFLSQGSTAGMRWNLDVYSKTEVDDALDGIETGSSNVDDGSSDGDLPEWDATEGKYVPVSPSEYTIGVDLQAWDALLDDIADLTDPGADRLMFWDDSTGVVAWLSIGTGLSISGTTISATGGGGDFAFDTFPTYEDSAHSSGIAVNGTTLAVYSDTAEKWLTVALSDTLDPTPAGGAFLEDSFYEASSTALTSHSPETGGTWVKDPAWIGSTVNVSTDGISLSANAYAVHYNDETPGSADYSVAVQGTTGSTNWDRSIGACARLTGSGDGYCATLQGNGAFYLNSFADGTGTTLDSATGLSISTTTTYTVTITVAGTSITATVHNGGTLIDTLSATNSTYSAAGYAGVRQNGTSSRMTNVEAE